eukprot:CAMPEP_0202899738 /NCGR_PEP_ID=MMETSP1392-20130828/7886_1 /ASSEMBLY_ACC=CAM_ASM_000868 /TAXON_ID=225041 /ORGANISM="Chlamydomonas chlamydogama, Strain SAG 11-48b" /LENGTH=422 /DNA_ID=CAMNT_0049585993 /DNA_START=199 /DNA_END=1465 /DNA_ORIENTATION=-
MSGYIKENNELLERILHYVKPGSEASRHASSISVNELEALESALRVAFVKVGPDQIGPYDPDVEPDLLDPDVDRDLMDATEFTWDANKHEATQAAEYMKVLETKVALPSHLRWSLNDNKRDRLQVSKHTGGASLPFGLECRTDALVVVRKVSTLEESAVVATVDVNKRVVAQSRRQTKATYICASLNSHLPAISVVTDMQKAAVAYYANGQRMPGDGRAIIIERVFVNADEMMTWLRGALSAESVQADVWHFREPDGHIVLPDELPNPRRIRMPVPIREVSAAEVRGLLAALTGCDDNDIANLGDVEDEAAWEHPGPTDAVMDQAGSDPKVVSALRSADELVVRVCSGLLLGRFPTALVGHRAGPAMLALMSTALLSWTVWTSATISLTPFSRGTDAAVQPCLDMAGVAAAWHGGWMHTPDW